MKVSIYHVLLRVSALTLALVLLFDSGILSPVTKELSKNTQLYLASAVGVGASIEATEINTLSAQISERNRELDAREATLDSREISVGLNTSQSSEAQSNNLSTYILSVILFILIVLIVLNYALDYARDRKLLYIKNNGQTV